MSRSAGWFPPNSTAASVRVVMLGAVVGAFALLALSMLTSWPVRVGQAGFGGPDAPQVVDAAPGSCLDWSTPNGSDMAAVPCDQPHVFEVSGVADVTGYPPGSRYPDPALWQRVSRTACTEPTVRYLGRALDPAGRFSVGALTPTQQQWNSGDRTLRCGLRDAGPSGALLPTRGKVAEIDQSAVYDVGTCLGIQGKGVGDPVDCARPHSYEIVGVIDLGTQFPGGFPPEDKQDQALATLCGKLAADYTGGANLGAQGLTLTWDDRQQDSWATGSHRVNCKVGQRLPDNSGLAPLTGSVRAAKRPAESAPQEAPPPGPPAGNGG